VDGNASLGDTDQKPLGHVAVVHIVGRNNHIRRERKHAILEQRDLLRQ
jgi:hypothetical protein